MFYICPKKAKIKAFGSVRKLTMTYLVILILRNARDFNFFLRFLKKDILFSYFEAPNFVLLTFVIDFLGKGSGLFLVNIDAKFLTEGSSLGKSSILALGFSSVVLESSFSKDRSIIDLLGLILTKGCRADKCISVVLPLEALFIKLLILSATLPSVRQSDSELLMQTVEILRRLLRFELGFLGGRAGGGDGLRLSVDKNRFLGGKAGGLEVLLLVLSEPSSIDKRLSVDL